MGSEVHVVVVGQGAADAMARVPSRIAQLERRWSRFRPDSELSRLNSAGGNPVLVSPETFDVIALARRFWEETDHHFDPTVGSALVAAGYDRTFEQLDPDGDEERLGEPTPTGGCDAIGLDPITRSVILPLDVQVDLGGIGKGRAADLVVADLARAGVAGACVNLGGDLRVWGESPTAQGWSVGIDAPLCPGAMTATVVLESGAVATSSRTRRRWRRAGVDCHHLIDPATGAPAATDIVAVSVIDGEAASAEVWAKSALIAGLASGADLLRGHDRPALMTMADGTTIPLCGWEDYAR